MIPRRGTASVRESKAAPEINPEAFHMVFPSERLKPLVLTFGPKRKSRLGSINPRKLTDEEHCALFDNDRDRRILEAWFVPRLDTSLQ
jgi:hypothetical protein